MSAQRAYIEGFVKRASEYGFSKNEAVKILKQANALNIAPKQDPMIIAPTPGAPSHLPPVKPTYDYPQQPSVTPEVNNQLTSLPLSNMTPKDKWVQGLGEIMGQKPALAANKINASAGGPSQFDIADDHAKDVYKAITGNLNEYRKNIGASPIGQPGGIKGFFKGISNKINPPPNQLHIDKLKEHFKQYDPSWGNNFRLPLPDNPAGAGDDLKYYHNTKDYYVPAMLKGMNYLKNG